MIGIAVSISSFGDYWKFRHVSTHVEPYSVPSFNYEEYDKYREDIETYGRRVIRSEPKDATVGNLITMLRYKRRLKKNKVPCYIIWEAK